MLFYLNKAINIIFGSQTQIYNFFEGKIRAIKKLSICCSSLQIHTFSLQTRDERAFWEAPGKATWVERQELYVRLAATSLSFHRHCESTNSLYIPDVTCKRLLLVGAMKSFIFEQKVSFKILLWFWPSL